MAKSTLTEDDVPENTRPNKSQMKRDMDDNKALGEKLAGIKPHLLARMSLDEELITALTEAHRLSGNKKAYRRQLLFVARIIRQLDIPYLIAELEKLRKSGY